MHKTRRGRIIAEPVLWAVERIEEIAGYLERPPRVYPMFGRSVLAFSPLDSVAYAVRNMHELDYSQAPVYSKDEFAGLLTADALVSWVGSRSEQCLDLCAFTVNEVLQQEGKKTGECRFVSRDATLFELLGLFDKSQQSGKRLDAVLITDNGQPSSTVLGIVTPWDLSKAFEAVGVRPRGSM